MKSSNKTRTLLKASADSKKSLHKNTPMLTKILSAFRPNILSNLPGYVYWIDTHGVFLGCNKNFANRVLLQTCDEIVGMTYSDLFSQEYADFCRLIDAQIFEKKLPQIVEDTFNQSGAITAYYVSNKSPVFDEKHNVIGLINITLDITQQREAELLHSQEFEQKSLQKQRAAEQRERDSRLSLESIIAHMPGNVYWLDRSCIQLGCNDNVLKMLGITREQYIGKSYEDLAKLGLWTEGQGEKFKKDDMEVMTSGKAKLNVEEPPLRDVHGNISYYLTSRVPLRDEAGNVTGVAGISIDITDRKKAEEALKEAKLRAESASLAKSEFLATVSHELRIPLTSILGMAQLIRTQKLTPKKQIEYVEHISTAGSHLLSVINDILDFAQLEAEKFELFPAPIDLKALIEETCVMLTQLAKAKNLELLVSYDPEAPHLILGDSRAIRQILINLVGNAIKFTEKGFVSIDVECIDNYDTEAKFAITVKDSGIGIPPDKQGIVFDHFSQVDSSQSRKYPGTGLGLAITKKLIGLMNGSIGVSSKVGQGSTFRSVLNFPLQTKSIISSPWLAYQSQARVLIVDDTPRGEITRRHLGSNNCDVVRGAEAFDNFLTAQQINDPYRIVIIDQNINKVDPFKLARLIKSADNQTEVMQLILLEEGSANAKKQAKRAGFFDSIVKPIRPVGLQTALTAAWERWIEEKGFKSVTPHKKDKKSNSLKVLLVEDDALVKIVHTDFLHQLDCKVEIASDGKDALKMLKNKYDLVLLDMGLPDIPGVDVIKEFRAKIDKAHTPVIALTGYGNEADKQSFLDAGVDEVLVKPVDIELLKSVIQKQVVKSHRE